MRRRVEPIQAVREHTHRRQIGRQGLPMRVHVDAISQSAQDEHIRRKVGQILTEVTAKVLAILRNVARADHGHDILCIQIGRSAIKQIRRRIITSA